MIYKLRITISWCTLLLCSMLATSAQSPQKPALKTKEGKTIVDIDTLVNNTDIDTLELLMDPPETHDNQFINYYLKKEIDSIIEYKTQLANTYYQLGEYNKAYSYYKDLYKRDSNDITSILSIVAINEKIGRTKNNVTLYRRLIKIDPLNSTSYCYKLAPLLENHLLLRDALEAYHTIFNSNNKDWETAIRICDLSLKLRLQYQADSIINIAMKYNPDICILKYKKGGIAYLLGKYDSSIQYIKTAFSCGDTIPSYLKTIGLSYFYAEKYDSALNYLNKYLIIAGGDEKCYSSIGHIYTAKGNLDSATIYMTKACAAGISLAYIENSKSLAYMHEQKLQYEKALNMYYMIYFTSKDDEAAYAIAHIEDEKKHYENALVWYDKYINTSNSMFRDTAIKRKTAINMLLQDKK